MFNSIKRVGNFHRARRVRAREKAECELISRSGLFDRAWYLKQYPDVGKSGIDPILHYLRQGGAQGHNPCPLFASRWYLDQYPDIRKAGINPLVDYLIHGAAEGRDPNPMFDSRWYLAKNGDVAAGRENPLGHYCRFGWAEQNRDPSPLFDTRRYLAQHSEVAAENINPLLHYLQSGWNEGLLPHDPARALRGIRAAVIVHLFYADLWQEIAGWLRNIPIDFDLFVSVPRENAQALRALVARDYPRAQLVEVRNVGRDIGAFLAVLPRVLAGNYTVLCKLHTKKGRTEADTWRFLLLRGLLANKMLVTKILRAFRSDPELALVGPREVYLSGPALLEFNEENVGRITRHLYPASELPREWGFFAGTMFWARPEFFAKLAGIAREFLRFEDDNTRYDGQLAHALERVFGAMATLERKRIGLTHVTDLGPLDGAVHVMAAPGEPSQKSFGRALRKHAADFHRHLLIAGNARASTASESIAPEQLISQPRAPIAGPFAGIARLRNARSRRVYRALIAKSQLFDADWYCERYPDARGVDAALHYLDHGAAQGRNPGPLFDTLWYLSHYPDVAASGVNPLAHYLLYGAKEGRHPRPSEVIIGEVTDARLSCRKRPGASGEIALFAAHSPDGRLKPHVRRHLEALRNHGIRPVLIVAADAPLRDVDASMIESLEGLYVRQNIGYDFAAWAHVLREHPQLFAAEILYLINDSIVGPLNEQKFEGLLQNIRSNKSAVIGLTDNYERGWHIQSYFIALKGAALASPALRAFFDNVKNLSDKKDVVNAYEARLAPTLRAAGLQCEVLFPGDRIYNNSLHNWQALIKSGCPFVKVAALRDFADEIDAKDWRDVLAAEGFDHRIAERALAVARQT